MLLWIFRKAHSTADESSNLNPTRARHRRAGTRGTFHTGCNYLIEQNKVGQNFNKTKEILLLFTIFLINQGGYHNKTSFI